MTKAEEKAEILIAAFASVCNSKTSYSPRSQHLEMDNRDEEQNEVSIIQEEMVSNLLYHLDKF